MSEMKAKQDRKGYIASSISKSDTKFQHEASRLKTLGWRETDWVRSCNTRINVCIYNTRTLGIDDDTNRLFEELGNIAWHVVGQCVQKEEGNGLDFWGVMDV